MTGVRCAAVFGICIVLLGLSACSTAPTHRALVNVEKSCESPPLVPLRRFVANADDVGGFMLSPDGEKLAWQQTVGLDTGLAVRSVDQETVTRFATGFLSRRDSAGPTYTWLSDSRHLACLKATQGDKDTQLFVLDT